ncbi:MAG: dephospho-CoA kinase [Planctomycetales bacterium]|nr:dephospho-CoA kinase [Planctomycetales bacterium]
MIVVGIVGGIASGKSVVAREFQSLGAKSIDVDRVGHEVLTEPDVIQTLTERWGTRVVVDGQLDRQAIARIVFAENTGAAELAFLESVSHPKIANRVREELVKLEEQGTVMVILDAALLLKAGWDQMCDNIVFVDVDRETRIDRAVKGRGWTREEYNQREQSQLPLAEKRAKADILIDNSRGLDETRLQVRDVWERLIHKN